MIEVNEQELEVIKNGIFTGEPKEPTLGNATISQLVNEFIKRVPKENRKLTNHFDEDSGSVIGGCSCKITYWEESPVLLNVERECVAEISVETTGKIKDKGEQIQRQHYEQVDD